MTQDSTSVVGSDVTNEIRAQVPAQLRSLFDPQANSIPVLRATCQKILNISGGTKSDFFSTLLKTTNPTGSRNTMVLRTENTHRRFMSIEQV